jgi:hypothetical protein
VITETASESEPGPRLLLVVLGYLVGSIPFGLLLGRLAGVDVRRHGSGNIGVANVARNAGAWLGLATLVADAAKGATAVLAARALAADGAIVAATGVAAFLRRRSDRASARSPLRHLDNFGRLHRGTEPRFTLPKRQAPPGN